MIRPGVELPLLRRRAAHQPLVGAGRPARERHRLARGGGARRRRLVPAGGLQAAGAGAAGPAGHRHRPGHPQPGPQPRAGAGAPARPPGGSAARAARAPALPARAPRRGAGGRSKSGAPPSASGRAGARTRTEPEPMSSRSAGFWVAVFLLLAFAGGGGLDLLSGDSGTNRADLTGRVTRVVDGDTVKVRLAGGRGTQHRALHRRRHARDRQAGRAGAVLRQAGERVQRAARRGPPRAAARSGASARTATAACSPTSTCAGTATRS